MTVNFEGQSMRGWMGVAGFDGAVSEQGNMSV
jgi:hypothetical protein